MAEGVSVTYDLDSHQLGAEARGQGMTVAYDSDGLSASYTNGGLTLAYDQQTGISANYGDLSAAYSNDGRLTGSYGAVTYNNGQWGIDPTGIRGMLISAGSTYVNNLVNQYASEFALPGQIQLGINANGQLTGSYSMGGLTFGSNGNVSGNIGGDTPFGALGLNVQDGNVTAGMATDYGNIGLDSRGRPTGSIAAGPLGLGMHDGQLTGQSSIGPINLDYTDGQFGGGMALGGSNVSYGNGSWGGTVEGNAVEQALGGAGVDTSGFEITDATYNANTGWTGAVSNEFGTWNQDGQYSTTVIPDDGDVSTTWPAVQEVAIGVKTTVSDIWASIFGGEKPAEQPGQQAVVTEGTTPNNGDVPAKEEPPTDEESTATEKRIVPFPNATDNQLVTLRWMQMASMGGQSWDDVLSALWIEPAVRKDTKEVAVYLGSKKSETSKIVRKKDGSMELYLDSATPVKLAGYKDFGKMLEGAARNGGYFWTDTANEFVDTLVGRYYAGVQGKGGRDDALNQRGAGSFSYSIPPPKGVFQVLGSGPANTLDDWFDDFASQHLSRSANQRQRADVERFIEALHYAVAWPVQNKIQAARDSEKVLQYLEPDGRKKLEEFMALYGSRLTPNFDKYQNPDQWTATIVGLECEPSSAVLELKALGLIPPDLSREEFEYRYTRLHQAAHAPEHLLGLLQEGGPRLPETQNSVMRGITHVADERAMGAVRGEWATTLAGSDWAVLTGAAGYTYKFQKIAAADVARVMAETKQVIYRFSSPEAAHSILLAGSKTNDPHVIGGVDYWNKQTYLGTSSILARIRKR